MEDKFRESFEKSPIGIIFFDKEGNFTDANKSAFKIGGVNSSKDIKAMNLFYNTYIKFKRDELLEKRYIKLQAPFDFNNLKKLGVFNTTRSDIAFIEADISVIDSGFLVQIQDITQQKEAEEALRENEAKIQTLLEYTPAGMVLFDAKPPYTVLVHNKYYQELFAEPFRSKGMVG